MLSRASRRFGAAASLFVAGGVCAGARLSGAGSDTGVCKPIVVCGPSGAGKSTLIKQVMKKHPNCFGFSVSHTTRGPRRGEKDGVDYHFVTHDVMEQGLSEGAFLEHATVHGEHYGTSKAGVNAVTQQHKVCVLDIDIQGVQQVKKVQETGEFDAAAYIFIAPPSLEELEKRLRHRGTESEEKIKLRLKNAYTEIFQANGIHWDAFVINDDLQVATKDFEAAVLPAVKACKCE